MGSITYFFEDVPVFTEFNEQIVQNIDQIISLENFTCEFLNFIFCSDEYLYQINVKYLDHHYFTDVITFDYSESPLTISGDIFISIDRIIDNAQLNNVSFFTEVFRVMIHGVLHLVGYDDKTIIQKEIMHQQENLYLLKFGIS
jgi:rRNA maturation RNase YbeY